MRMFIHDRAHGRMSRIDGIAMVAVATVLVCATAVAFAGETTPIRLCRACASVGGGGQICDSRLCFNATGCGGETFDSDGDGQDDSIRAICKFDTTS